MANQPFDIEEWLESKKKGFSGKIPRADFVSKIKELVAEIEQLENDKTQLTTKNRELENNLSSRGQIIQEKEKAITEYKTSAEQIKQELNTKLQSKEEELKNLQQRPDITNEKYQELLNNQEKHQEEDLKPANLPTDWEQQLEDKKKTETEFRETQKKLLETETKLKEAEKRPAQEDLKQAVQQEADKYKDYVKLTPQEQEAINNYSAVKSELEEAKKKQPKPSSPVLTEEEQKKLKEQLQTEKEKNKNLVDKLNVLPSPIVVKDEEIIKKVGEIINSAINPLRSEITELLKKQSVNNSQPNKSPAELPTDYEAIKTEKEELIKILETLSLKISESEEKLT